MADIILIQPPVSFKNDAWKKEVIPDTPHLGLLYLAAIVKILNKAWVSRHTNPISKYPRNIISIMNI